MLMRASRLLRQGAPAGQDWMLRIAARVPATGLSSSQVQALLQDEFPAFVPADVGAATLREAIEAYPQLLRVEELDGNSAKWRVQPASAASPSSAAAPEAHAAVLSAVQQYCARRAHSQRYAFLPLEKVLADLSITDPDVVEAVVRNSSGALEVQVGLRVMPNRTPRAVVAFVDGDLLPAAAVNSMCEALGILKESSLITIVRQAGSRPLSDVDHVCPDVLPTYLSIERHAHELRLRRPAVRRDIVYMCSASQFDSYAHHVAPLNEFPDADVYVCCPSKIAVVQPKRVIPFE